MRVIVKLFAGVRELAGRERIEIELAEGANVAALRAAMGAEYPPVSPLLPYTLFAIGARYATDETAVAEGSEVACVPPVSGG